MTTDQFWALVAAARAAAPSTGDRAGALVQVLSGLLPEEIVSFNHHFTHFMHAAYTWPLWGAAYILGQGCSDDGFTDFRAWLISMGREVYERAVLDPDSLADIALGPHGESDVFLEEYAYAPDRAFERVTGRRLPATRQSHPLEPTGLGWSSHAEFPRRYPRLTAKHGAS